MSQISFRPRVLKLPPELIAAANTSARLAFEVFEPLMAGHPCLQQLVRNEFVSDSATGLSRLRGRFTRLQQEALDILRTDSGRAGPDSMALATATALAGAGYVVDERMVAPMLGFVRGARCPEEAQQRFQAMARRVEAGHRRAIENGLAEACTRASVKSGFGDVEACRGADGAIRVLAIDPAGRALVSEIRVPDGEPPSLATEVLGATDNRCADIIDRFDTELDGTGIRVDRVERSRTGGVPRLRAAREAIHRLLGDRCQISSMAPSFHREEEEGAKSGRRLCQEETTRSRG